MKALILALVLAVSGSAMAAAAADAKAADAKPAAVSKKEARAGCLCDYGSYCVGPRGGKYCINKKGNKKYI